MPRSAQRATRWCSAQAAERLAFRPPGRFCPLGRPSGRRRGHGPAMPARPAQGPRAAEGRGGPGAPGARGTGNLARGPNERERAVCSGSLRLDPDVTVDST
jgi:hypothetical protein